MKKNCPKCQSSFECKNNDILNCDCATVILSAESYEYISKTYNDCLCKACLLEIEDHISKQKKVSINQS